MSKNPVHDLRQTIKDGLAGFEDRSDSTVYSIAALTKSRRWKLSRAACLHLINRLARYSPSGIILMMLVSVWVGVSNFSHAPIPSMLWAGMVMVSGGKLLIRNRSFLAGDASVASRPFYWRACHTSNLAVFGTAFGAGMIMLIPANVALDSSIGLMVLMIIASFFGAVAQFAHGRAIFAILFPVLVFASWATYRIGLPASYITIASAAAITSLTLLALLAMVMVRRADNRYPRTVYEPLAKNVSRLPFRRKALPSVVDNQQQLAVS